MVEVSEYPLKFKKPIFRKTESPHVNEFYTLC